MHPRLKKLFFAISLCLLLGLSFTFFIAHQLVAPVPRIIGAPPASLGAITVSFPSKSRSTIAGWLAESDQDQASGVILLLHGIRADRRSMIDRAPFLKAHGYHTLFIDLQAHGESPGKHITMGHLESLDAAAAVAFLQSRYPTLPIAIIGSSLGGAAALMADYQRPPQAIICEEVFADVETAVSNRLNIKLGLLGHWLSPLLTWQIEPLLGIKVASLSPATFAEKITLPVFVLCGELDRHAKPAESKLIFTALKGPKQFWQVPAAAHIDLHRSSRQQYEQRILQFLHQHLQSLKAPAPLALPGVAPMPTDISKSAP